MIPTLVHPLHKFNMTPESGRSLVRPVRVRLRVKQKALAEKATIALLETRVET